MVIKELFTKIGFDFDEEAFAKAEHALGGLSSGLAAIGAAAAGAAAGFVYMMGEVASAATEVGRAAQRAGVTTDAIQELDFAAKRSGLSTEALEHGIRHLAHTMVEAQQGSSEAAYTLQQVGVHAKDSSGKLKSADMILEEMATRFHSMPDGIQKTGLAMKVFGRAGGELIPFLDKGKEGIEALRGRARELGVVMDADMIARAKEFKRSSVELSAALEGLKIALVGPTLGASKLKDALTAFIVKNREAIAQGFQKFLTAVTYSAKVLMRAFEALIHVMDLLYKIFGPVGLPAALALTAMAFGLLEAESVAAALASAAAWVMAALPIVGMLAAIALVILVLDDLWVFLKGGKSVIGEYLIPAFHKFFDEKLPEWIAKGKQLFKEFLESAKATVLDAVNPFSGIFSANPGAATGANPGGQLIGGGAAGLAASAHATMPHTSAISVSVGDVHVSGAGKDASQIGGEIAKHVANHVDALMRKTNAAVGGAR